VSLFLNILLKKCNKKGVKTLCSFSALLVTVIFHFKKPKPMRNYLLFYTIFTAAVVGAAYFYRQQHDEKQFLVANTLGNMNNNFTGIFENSNKNNLTELHQTIKSYLPFKEMEKGLGIIDWKWNKYDIYIENFIDKNLVLEADSLIECKKWSADDIVEYAKKRNSMKKYYTDSLFYGVSFYKNEKIAYLENNHEKAMEVFFQNSQKYKAIEQYRCLNGDKLYWQLNLKRVVESVARDLKIRQDAMQIRVDKAMNFHIVMQTETSVQDAKKPFTAVFSFYPLLTNDEALRFSLNERTLKPKNGQAFFSFPAGKASEKERIITVRGSFENLETGQTNSSAAEMSYKVID
jgi:hypothetical protein